MVQAEIICQCNPSNNQNTMDHELGKLIFHDWMLIDRQRHTATEDLVQYHNFFKIILQYIKKQLSEWLEINSSLLPMLCNSAMPE